MAFTLETAQTIFAGALAPSPIPGIVAEYEQLSVEDRLALLWFAYTETGRSITPVALGAANMALVENLLRSIEEMTPAEQTQVMVDLASRVDTYISRSYASFSVNTKLGFWYQLADWMAQGIVAPIPPSYQMSATGVRLFKAIQELDGGQQIQVLRDIALNMGFDTSAPPDLAPKEDFRFDRVAPAPAVQIQIEGVNEPAVLHYIEAMNRDDFEAAVSLFEPNGALQPPFQKPIVGREAIVAYMAEEAQGLNMMPESGVVEVLPDGSKKIRVVGKVQTPWFGVNVAMNIAWRFALTGEGKIFFVAIDMLASPEELINLKPASYR